MSADTIRQNHALRMLHDGYSPAQISERTGMSTTALEQLVRDFPGAPRPTRPAAGCHHIVSLPVAELLAHPDNIRADLEVDQGLIETIAEHGVLQPVLVMQTPDGWVLLDGHRRLAAARQARITQIPVRVHEHVGTDDSTLVMLITGLQKADLHPLDEALAYHRLIHAGHDQRAIALAVGKSQGHVSQRLALLNLTPEEQDALRRGDLGVVQAYRAGRDRSPGRRPNDTHRPKPKYVPHFTSDHALAPEVRAQCTAAGHATLLKLGPACGPCWESAIRRAAYLEYQNAAEIAS